MEKTRKFFCVMFMFLLIFVFQTAWQEVSGEEWSLTKAAEPWKGKTLRFIGESLPPLEALDRLKGGFEEATGVKVVIEQYGHEEVVEKTMADFVGRTQIYDLIISPHREIGRYVENDWLLPIETFMNDPELRDPAFELGGGKAFLNEWYWHETSWYRDTAYGLPFHFITMYLWWRYDLLENPEEQAAFKAKYGYDLPAPPINWDEYRDVAEFFTRKKGEKLAGQVLEHDFYGNTIQGKRHVSAWYTYLNVLYSFGGRVIDVPGKGSEYGPVAINAPEAVESLEYYKSLIPFCPPGVLTYGWDESQAAMQQNLAAMGIQWDDAVGAVENPDESLVAGKIAYSGVPIKKEKAVQVEGWSYFVPKLSKKPGLAWLFMQWAMGTEQQKAQMRTGGQSAVRATYDDPEVRNLPYTPVALYLKSAGQDVLGVRKAGAENGWGVPERFLNATNPKTGDTSVTIVPKATFPEQEEIVDGVILAVSKALSGELSPKEALDEAAATAAKILGDKAK